MARWTALEPGPPLTFAADVHCPFPLVYAEVVQKEKLQFSDRGLLSWVPARLS